MLRRKNTEEESWKFTKDSVPTSHVYRVMHCSQIWVIWRVGDATVSTHGTVAPLAVRSFCQSSPNFLSLPWTAVYWWFIASGARLLVGSLSTHQKNLKVTSTGWNSGRIYSSFYGRKYCDCCPVSQNFICAVPICKAVTAFLNSGSVWKKSPEHLHDQGISARALLVSLEVRPSKLHSDSQLTKNRVWHGMVWHQVEYTDTIVLMGISL